MKEKDLWKKLSVSINYYIQRIWNTELLRDSNELLDEYLVYIVGTKKPYLYLDKQSKKFIELTDEDIDKIKQAFIERIEKKRIKYSSELKNI